MDHFTIVTDRLDQTIAFYAMLGLAEGPRPDFGVGGAWLYVKDRPVLHIILVDEMPQIRRGVLDHMAFTSHSLLDVARKLDSVGIDWRLIRTPRPFSRWQMFLDDPNGVQVELDFDISETPPEDWKTRAAARRATEA
jgi:catechol 2,3-dioxygenase-like lactoylglutathione lyase family enzyme